MVGGDILNTIWKDLLRGAVLGFALPAMILAVAWMLPALEEPQAESTTPTTALPASKPSFVPTLPDETEPEPALMIPVMTQDGPTEMELETYVIGVVLAEVPGSFSVEALKAQSVAARTFALRVCRDGRHDGAVCLDYGCCQGYCSAEAYLAQGGQQELLDRIVAAVQATEGQVLTFDGEVICATYFSCSGGSTEAAVAVWGSEVPYLQAVESPGEEFAQEFFYRKEFSLDAFQDALCVFLPDDPSTWFGQIVYTEGGGVDNIEIGGVCYRGTTIRSLLGLRSTAFTVSVTAESIVIDTLGYGHRVGMSQYGAEAMAQEGYSYDQILFHYYLGVTLQTYIPNE